MLSYNAPVYWNDKFIGVVGIELDDQTLAREVENIRLYDSGYAFILDADGNIIYHPHLDSEALAEQGAIDTPDGLISDDSHVRYVYEGIEKEGVWMPLGNGMHLYVTVPVSEVDSGWQSLVRNVLLASLLVLLIAVAFTMRFADRLTKPLSQLTEAAKQIGDGNYDFALDYKKSDEVGILTRTFEQLAADVKEHIGELSERVNTDPLTSVRNKWAYGDCIQELQDCLDASEDPVEFAIGVFDCDGLKAINDTFGHDKGDLYLKAACRLICRTFPNSPVFRVGGDEFAVILRGDDYQNKDVLLDQFRKTREEICENAENEWDRVSVTLGLAVYDPSTDVEVFDVSRRADQLMFENKRIWKEILQETSQGGQRTKSTGKNANGPRRPANMGQYILDHFDEAMERGDIKVYFQPVVRTLTRQVCGMEALARWQTDKYGLFMPGEFVGVLEKRRRIHDLDMYVLRKVCENYSREKWRADVPISINLSRIDYELFDVFEVVESEVRANKVPRSSLCIEITESVMASNDSLMRRCIERFRDAGYSVWIDDFGSGYSSLNVLKDSEFDEVKLDMRFLSDFHTRSKKILASIVHMAKEIGIHTLAEGVETEEQFEFLRNIGCEKVQGFLFARPMPFQECLEHVAAAGMTWEPPAMRRYYDDVGSLDVLSASPIHEIGGQDEEITGRELNSISMAIVELRGDRAEMLYANDAFDKVASAVEWPLAWDSHAESSRIPLGRVSQRIQKLLEETRTGGRGRLLSVYNNDYYEMSGLRLASSGDACAVLISVSNLSQMSAMVAQQQLDEGLRSLYSVYEQVSLINLNDLTVVALYLERDSGHKMPTGSLLVRIEEYVKRVFPDDRDRFRQFIAPDTLEERAAREGGISIHLRVMSFHGSYDWKSFQLVRIHPNVYYLLIRSAESEVQELRSAYQAPQESDAVISPVLLWENVVNRYELKFFWKDRDRRFVGASRSFLDHYSLSSQADIAGKTDEDMGWHIHNDPFRDEEWKVINEGITSRHVEGNCLVQGEDHEIVATKMPLFDRDGKIVGLIGSFYQTDAHVTEKEASMQVRSDDLTGLLNSRGLYEDMFAYIDEYQLRGRDFARIEVSIDGFEDINDRYGYDFGDAVIRETGRALLQCCGNAATVGRVSGCVFMVLRQFDDTGELDELVTRIRRIPEGLREVNGVPFNIYLSVGTALYSETEDRDGMAAQAEMRRMTDDVEGISQHQLMENTGRIFRMFDELPLAYAVYKVFSGPEGDDALVLYANEEFTKMARLTLEELIGAKVSSFYAVDSNGWIKLAVQAGIEGRTVSGKYYHAPLGFEIEAAAYPVIGPGFCAFTFRPVVG